MALRRLSLHSDLEEEIWKLYKELMDEHGMSLEEAIDTMMFCDQQARKSIQDEN